MAITIKSNNYQNIIGELNCKTNKINNILNKLKKNELLRKINFYGTLITLIITINISLNTKGSIFIIGILGLPIGAIISIYLHSKANSLRSILDNEIFNNFLIKKIKIFYPQDDINNIEYTHIKQISVKSTHTENEHQAIIDIAYKAYKENATGIIITDSNLSNVVTVL